MQFFGKGGRMNFITIDCSRYAEKYLILHDVVICCVFNFRFQQFVSTCLFCKFCFLFMIKKVNEFFVR